MASPGPLETRLPSVTMARPTRPSIGEMTRVNSRSSSRGAQRRLDRGDRGGRLVGRRGPAFALLGGDGVLAGQPLGPLQLGGGALHRRAGPRQLGGEPIDLRLEGPGVDLEEHLAAADDRALLERHGGDEAGNARPDVDRVAPPRGGRCTSSHSVMSRAMTSATVTCAGGGSPCCAAGRAQPLSQPAARSEAMRRAGVPRMTRLVEVSIDPENCAPRRPLHNRAQGRRGAPPKAAPPAATSRAGRPRPFGRDRSRPDGRWPPGGDGRDNGEPPA